MNELTKRVLVALIGIPFAIGIFYYGGWFLIISIAIIAAIGQWEFYNIAEKKSIHPYKFLSISSGVVFILFFAHLVHNQLNDKFEAYLLLFAPLIIVVLSILSIQIFTGKANTINNISVSIAGIVYVPMMFSTLIGIREFDKLIYNKMYYGIDKFSNGDFGYLLFIMFASVWICDSAAYFGGKSFGKHKLLERVSPKKTWEGAICGFIFSIIGFAVLSAWLIPQLATIHSIIIGAGIGILGQIGDLAESQLKRDAGVKDSSHILPGHGGILDRFDSILFVVPFVFFYLLIMFFMIGL